MAPLPPGWRKTHLPDRARFSSSGACHEREVVLGASALTERK